MARIRTIKPEFWTDEALTECSLSARLLFIGTWNFADDAGNLDRSPKQIKARVFPLDTIDCEPLIQELIAQDLLTEYTVSGKTYLHIQGFAKHQIINRPSQPTCPPFDKSLISQPPLTEHSLSAHTGREGRGEEGKGENLSTAKAVEGDSKLPPCPHQEIISTYHEVLPDMPQVREWNPTRQGYMRQRWKQHPSLDYWKSFFSYVSESDFLMGRKDGRGGAPPFVADLEWLIRPTNFAKVIEGKYHRGE